MTIGTGIQKQRHPLAGFRRFAVTGLLVSLSAFAQTAPAPRPPPGKLKTICAFSLCGCGTIFRVTPGGDLTTLYSFTGGVSGQATPRGSMTLDSQGNLYGTTAGTTSLEWAQRAPGSRPEEAGLTSQQRARLRRPAPHCPDP